MAKNQYRPSRVNSLDRSASKATKTGIKRPFGPQTRIRRALVN
jgi:hypothetical protein